MPKNHRKRLKKGGNHTSFIDAAAELRDFARKLPEVTSVAAGRIDTNLGNGKQGVKLKPINSQLLLVLIRGGASVQEVRIHTKCLSKTEVAIRQNFMVK